MIPHTEYVNKPFPKAYLSALIITMAAAAGFLSAFIWRDIIVGLFKKYDLYDCEEGFKKENSIYWAIGIAIGITLFTALLTVAAVKFNERLNIKQV